MNIRKDTIESIRARFNQEIRKINRELYDNTIDIKYLSEKQRRLKQEKQALHRLLASLEKKDGK